MAMHKFSEAQINVIRRMSIGQDLIRSEWRWPRQHWFSCFKGEGDDLELHIEPVSANTINKLMELNVICRGQYEGAFRYKMKFTTPEMEASVKALFA